MSGVCGIVLRNQGKGLSTAQLACMVRSLDVTGLGEDAALSFGSIGLGAQTFPGRVSGVTRLTRLGQTSGLAFHGSIYNLKELISAGVRDSDVLQELLSLYLEEGTAFMQRLRAEFALAIWDARDETLYLATDRFRVHPLFYYQDPGALVFASRMQGLLACPFVTKSIDPTGIIDIVASSMIPTPRTIFREIQKLPPGCLLTYQRGESRLTSYWDINFMQPSARSERELARQLKAQFLDAISVRFTGEDSSERIGTFLSGGVDSSTVTGILTQLAERPIKSFSIGFDEQRFNEIQYARIAARAFAAEHYEYFVTPQDVYNVIPILLDSFDEPFANASAVPTYFCAKLARENGVDVLYAGDGGDELFAGNERYATQRLFDYYQIIPGWLRKAMVQPLIFTLADVLQWGLLVKGKKYIRRANVPYPERLSSYGLFKLVSLAEWFDDGFLMSAKKDYDPYAAVRSYYFQAPARTELDRQLYIDLKLAISDNDLFKVTRMTETAGVTVRYPFLDHRLAEFAATVPAKLKMRGLKLRSFFKNAYADLLPQEIRAKQKHGFGLPIPVWLRTDKMLNEMMYDLVLSPRTIQRGYFRRKAMEKLVELHKTDETSFYGAILWNFMVLELWHRTYLDFNNALKSSVDRPSPVVSA